ncbi:hypothetical protein [Paludisphaera mucosa]|uniref:Uncharacterized protein n=1 Tax=Paludisphaera mucosa TaxID=3030827 RepID=A0ABT6F442_9BACT|nr:hypothetical protein [Paludisphaera mucosa]MDG3002282.1 hypothetical protein [Paludisphaera mucosa]
MNTRIRFIETRDRDLRPRRARLSVEGLESRLSQSGSGALGGLLSNLLAGGGEVEVALIRLQQQVSQARETMDLLTSRFQVFADAKATLAGIK